MYRLLIIFPLIFWPETAFSQSQTAKITIDSLQWMSGYWKNSTTGSATEEQWMSPLNKLMVGMGRATDTGRNASFEFLRIVQDQSGTVRYIALPSGKNETVFTLTHYHNREVWFENPNHDFPRKIIYRLINPKEIMVILEGIEDGEFFRHEYILYKENCGD